jgi:hypothetical protein
VAPDRTTKDLRTISLTQSLARSAWVAFVLTFIVARALVLLSTADFLPELHLQLGDTHVHHLNFGIFILAATGAFLLFVRPSGRNLRAAAVIYGVGLALTFDEFGMWLHLEDLYWQRASFDAVVVIAGLLGLVVAAPALRRFRPREWATVAGLALAVVLFGLLVLRPLWSSG